MGLRLYYSPQRTQWDADAGRDALVSYHYVHFGEWADAAPYSAGSENLLKKSPVYYYLTSVLWFVGRSVYGYLIFFLLFHTSAIIPLYIITERLFNKLSAFISTGLYIGLPYFVNESLAVREASFITPFVLWVLMLLLLAVKRKSNILLLGSLIVGFLGLHIHPSFLPFLLISMGISLWYFRDSKTTLLYLALVIIVNFFLWIWLINRNPENNPYGYIYLLRLYMSQGSWVDKFQHNIQVFYSLFFSLRVSRVWAVVLLTITTSLFFVKKETLRFKYFTLLLYVSAGYLFTITSAFYLLNDASYYLISPYFALYLPVFSWMIEIVAKRLVNPVFVSTLFMLGLICYTQSVVVNEVSHRLQTSGKLSSIIADDIQKTGQHQFSILDCGQWDSYCSEWKSAHIWLLLELRLKRRFVVVTQGDYNFRPLVTPIEWVYIVCRRKHNAECEREGSDYTYENPVLLAAVEELNGFEHVLYKARVM